MRKALFARQQVKDPEGKLQFAQYDNNKLCRYSHINI